MKQTNFHKGFRLNGHSFSSIKELLEYSYQFSDELGFFLEDWFSKDDCIYVQTSGSTGKPKLIQLQKKHIINAALATGNFFQLQENTKALLCLSIAYIAGKMMLIRGLTLGWQLDIAPSNSSPLKKIEKKYHFSAMVPLQLENSLDRIHLIDKLIVGGGVVSKNLEKKIQNSPTKIFATYGMTETITHIAIKKLNNTLFSSKKSYYQTLPNITIYKDQRNCLVVEAPKISDQIIFTNDVVALISDTQFEWLGRFDTIINSGGIKLQPEKIEEKLSVALKERFFVVGIQDEILGEKMVLIVEVEGKEANERKEVILEKIKKIKSLSKYEIPKEIYVLNKFVETATKKIQRKKTLDLVMSIKKVNLN